ncbi:hypothetical protein CXB51_029290 [Gossypium anomalum]|uniref:Non-specific serine/threonine protein kinase n=1 Tax=Gossypium anomalum TaxID=47600 RepID=A0A8J5YNN0_9ROSI|nr:hypothetical protein CXB51_029290 [Gossypium anomalum]
MLTSLNLSISEFSGQIPSEISNLHRLSSLDLSYVDLASHIPSVLANLSSLTSLNLDSCGLQGMFPLAIFQRPKLETIWLVRNSDLKGYLPEFNISTKLKELALWNTRFSGVLPASIGNIDSLEYLGLGNCNFTGSVPSTWGNIPNLKFLNLGNNSFTDELPSINFKTFYLYIISLSIYLKLKVLLNCYFTMLVPPTLGNLTKLYKLYLQSNHFTGELPGNLTSSVFFFFFFYSSFGFFQVRLIKFVVKN